MSLICMFEAIDYYVLSSIGLVFDIIGVGFLFTTATPPTMKNGIYYMSNKGDSYIKKRVRSHKWRSWIGLSFMIIGFALQIFANHFY